MKTLGKIISVSIAAAAAFVFSASIAQAYNPPYSGPNLLVNGDFEGAEGPVPFPITLTNGGINGGWAYFGDASITYMPGGAHTGYYALLEQDPVGDDWNPAGAYQIINATPNDTYNLSVWWLTGTGTSSPVGPVDIQLQFFDNNLANLATYDSGWTGYGAPLATWQEVTLSGKAPSGTAYAAVYLMFMDDNQTTIEDVYFDTAVLVVVPNFTASSLSGGTFSLTWNGQPNCTYQLQYTTNLAAPVWQNLGSPIPSTNGTVSAVDILGGDAQRFYRVQLMQ